MKKNLNKIFENFIKSEFEESGFSWLAIVIFSDNTIINKIILVYLIESKGF